jgi:hypothetical protein
MTALLMAAAQVVTVTVVLAAQEMAAHLHPMTALLMAAAQVVTVTVVLAAQEMAARLHPMTALLMVVAQMVAVTAAQEMVSECQIQTLHRFGMAIARSQMVEF